MQQDPSVPDPSNNSPQPLEYRSGRDDCPPNAALVFIGGVLFGGMLVLVVGFIVAATISDQKTPFRLHSMPAALSFFALVAMAFLGFATLMCHRVRGDRIGGRRRRRCRRGESRPRSAPPRVSDGPVDWPRLRPAYGRAVLQDVVIDYPRSARRSNRRR